MLLPMGDGQKLTIKDLIQLLISFGVDTVVQESSIDLWVEATRTQIELRSATSTVLLNSKIVLT